MEQIKLIIATLTLIGSLSQKCIKVAGLSFNDSICSNEWINLVFKTCKCFAIIQFPSDTRGDRFQ